MMMWCDECVRKCLAAGDEAARYAVARLIYISMGSEMPPVSGSLPERWDLDLKFPGVNLRDAWCRGSRPVSRM